MLHSSPWAHQKFIACTILFFFTGNAIAGWLVDPDPEWKESEYTLPSPPQLADLREFPVDPASPNRYLVDLNSISVGADTVVRYTLVIQTAGGAQNITYEGIRCQTNERQLYATARQDGTWVPVKKSTWQPMTNSGYHRPAVALAEDYFCDSNAPPRDRAEIMQHFKGIFEHTDPVRGVRR